MDIREIIREELSIIFEEKSKSFFSKLREKIAPDGKITKNFKTKEIKDWPSVPDSDGFGDGNKETGTLDLENNEYISLDKNKLVMITGGDWQDAWIVEVGNAPGGLKVLNYRLPKKGEYKKLTKKGNRMSYDEIVELMYSDHPMNKSFENFVDEVKSNMRSYSPWSNTYGDEFYEEERVEGPKFDKEESVVYMTWYIGGHDKKAKEVGYKDMTHEARVEERFQDWVKDRFWNNKDSKFKLKNKEYKIKCWMESLGDDKVKYLIRLKEL